MNRKLFLMAFALLACLLFSLGAAAAEAYANYTPSNTTLTFYYDNYRASRTGTTYDLNTGANRPQWYSDGTYQNVTTVVFDYSFRNASAAPTTTYYWFCGMSQLSSIENLHYLIVSKVTNFAYMFYGCSSLTIVNLNFFYTDKATRMDCMFYGCSGLTELNLSEFDTSNVTGSGFYMMFSGCSNLTSLDLSSFNTSQATNMSYMFRNCTSLTDINLDSFDTSQATNMESMFYGCKGLTLLDLTTFNTSQVTKMGSMFYNCTNLETICAGDGWSTASVTSSSAMFSNCRKLVGGMGTTYNYSHTNADYAHIDGGTANPGYLTCKEVYACYTPQDSTLTFYYDHLRSTHTGTTYDLNADGTAPAWYTDGTCSSVTNVVFNNSFKNARPTTTRGWFCNMTKLERVYGMKHNLNTSEVTDMSMMFAFCSKLTNWYDLNDLSYKNTKKVTSMYGMFAYCSGLTSFEYVYLDYSNVTDMGAMFTGCSSMTTLEMGGYTPKVTNMANIFEGCSSLTSVRMYCTDSVTNMNRMFKGCSSLTSLDLRLFNTSRVTNMTSMFENCNNLAKIYVSSGWSTAAVSSSSSMFKNCTSLVGDMGTTYNASYTDKARAHIDGGTANPGYLSQLIVAYAMFTPEDSTFTFYYDGNRGIRPGERFDMEHPIFEGEPEWYKELSKNSVAQVVFDPSFANARVDNTFLWFADMENLKTITGLNYLNTSEVTSMRYMFDDCKSLTSLDLSNFNTANVDDMSYMFSTCPNLRTICVGDGWSTAAVTSSSDMFKDCTNLVGGKGTTYDANHVDAEYAHIDGGSSNPGYFTAALVSLLGDVNGDGVVNITDVTLLINAVLNDNYSMINVNNADLNGDGVINITDVTMVINLALAN